MDRGWLDFPVAFADSGPEFVNSAEVMAGGSIGWKRM